MRQTAGQPRRTIAGPFSPACAVIGFYSAVHLVNAFCWETHQLNPDDQGHPRRSAEVRMHFGREVASSYSRLSSLGWQARYNPGFHLSGSFAQDLLFVDLEAVNLVITSDPRMVS